METFWVELERKTVETAYVEVEAVDEEEASGIALGMVRDRLVTWVVGDNEPTRVADVGWVA